MESPFPAARWVRPSFFRTHLPLTVVLTSLPLALFAAAVVFMVW